MEKNIKNLLKRDLEIIPLFAYFIVYFLYLLFDRILNLKDYAILLKPIIIPIIAFLYIFNKNSKRTFLNLLLLLIIFISDNSMLLEIRSFYVYTTLFYFLFVFILLYYAILDSTIYLNSKIKKSKIAIVVFSIFLMSLSYLVFNFDLKEKAAEKFVAFQYMIVFIVLFLISVFNYIKQKSKKTLYLLLTIFCLFLTDLCFTLLTYYKGHEIFKYVCCFVEIPVYYFLLKYLLKRDKEIIEQ